MEQKPCFHIVPSQFKRNINIVITIVFVADNNKINNHLIYLVQNLYNVSREHQQIKTGFSQEKM